MQLFNKNSSVCILVFDGWSFIMLLIDMIGGASQSFMMASPSPS
jgi:hypothetical protein